MSRLATFGLLFALALPVCASESSTLFREVRVFSGTADRLSAPVDVLVVGNRIARIAAGQPVPGGATVIDGAGRTLMPGLIDAHWHMALAAVPLTVAMTGDANYLALLAAREAEAVLQRGFTSVRDAGGPVFGLKRAIDEGLVAGPRIYPSGAMVSQSGGHGDFRLPHEVPRAGDALSHGERMGAGMIADGPDAVLRRVREQLMLGASQIKLMAGGGVSSPYDPLDVTQYTAAEFRAAVEAAENWGTYVAVHAYTPRAIRSAVEAGVRVIEHGQLADEDTVRLMARKGTWWSLQPFLDDEFANPQKGPARAKQLLVAEGTDRAYRLARRHRVNVAWGTDILFSPGGTRHQNAHLVKMQRWYTPAEVLQMATSGNARLLALSGPRNPYPGKLGVVEEGALADLLLVEGDPLADLALLADPARNLRVVMKDGRIVRQPAVP